MDLKLYTVLSLYVWQWCVHGQDQEGCPYDNPDLVRWSNVDTWDGRMPDDGRSVTISRPILLDMSPPPLLSITIVQGGSLVWSDDGDYELVTGNVKVEGSFLIGGPACKFQHKAVITLTGNSNDTDPPEDGTFGRKFIGVAAGGSLEFHGKDKLSWTKLNRTVPALNFDNGLVYNHMSVPDNADLRYVGLYVTAWNPNGTMFGFRTFRVTESRLFIREAEDYVSFLDGIPVDSIVGIAVRKSFGKVVDEDYENIYQATERLGSLSLGSSKLREVGDVDAYAFIAVKGQNHYTMEKVDKYDGKKEQTDTGFVNRVVGDFQFGVRSMLRTDLTTTVTNEQVDFRSLTREAAFPKITTIDDVTSWNAGDKVVFASTDFDMEQAEELTVYPCFDCNSYEFRVERPFEFTHFGKITSGVDERGEVALLTRHILIQGQMEKSCYDDNKCSFFDYDTFGGHFMVARNYLVAHIEGVEFYHMGQQRYEGRHPVFFNMAGSIGCKAYVQRNSIHSSFSRCVSIKGTFGLSVEDNVGYDVLGHCYFLSDGAEQDNDIDGNIGLNTKYSTLLPTERSCEWHRAIFPVDGAGMTTSCTQSEGVSTFWIAHPNNIVRNNVAAGSVGAGFWYPMFTQAVGESAFEFFYTPGKPLHTQIQEFTNNVAHSSSTGLMLENRIQTSEPSIDEPAAFLAFIPSNKYEPWVDADNAEKGRATSLFNRLTAYKNTVQNVYMRGGDLKIAYSSFGDSPVGVMFVTGEDGMRSMTDCVFVGQSENKGLPCSYKTKVDGITYTIELDHSVPNSRNPHNSLIGYPVNGGPSLLNSVYFDKYQSEYHQVDGLSLWIPAGGIGFRQKNTNLPSITAFSGAQFGFVDKFDGNRVFNGNDSIEGFTNLGGDQLTNFYDADGGVTGYPDTTVVKNHPFLTTPRCIFRDNWQMSICPYHYSLLDLSVAGTGNVFMMRDDAPGHSFGLNDVFWNDFLLINGKTYTLHFNVSPPTWLDLKFSFAYGHSGDWVRIGLCYPKDVDGFIFSDDRTPVSSLAEVDADETGGVYYWDSAIGLLFIKIVSESPDDGKMFECNSDAQCPTVKIKRIGGSDVACDCTIDAYGPYAEEPETSPKLEELSLSNTYAIMVGAGSSRPFSSRAIHITGDGSADSNYIVDGNWGMWTAWSECSKTCDGNRQRTRECDSPSPRNGGLGCAGSHVDVEVCNEFADGNWGAWSSWMDCTVACGSGTKTRFRACDSPPAVCGGLDCEGPSVESLMCNTQSCPTIIPSIDEFLVAMHHNFSHLGCFVETRPREFTQGMLDNRFDLTVEFCMGHCIKHGFFYAALQNGRFCYCSHNYGRYGESDSSECDQPCPGGDESRTCGGYFRNDVYYTGKMPPPTEPCLNNHGVRIEDKCYLFMQTPSAWFEAEQECMRLGGDLATILDGRQQAFMEYHIMGFGYADYWIGLNDMEEEGRFHFTDETETAPGHWNNFAPGQPDARSENDDCVEMSVDLSYKWSDVSCSTNNAYICQIEVPGEKRCGPGNEGYSSYARCFIFVKRLLTWDAAVTACAIRGAIPAVISDMQTQLFVTRQIAMTGSVEDWYFGLNDISEEGNYTFMYSLNDVDFEKYAYGEPSGNEDEDCTVLNYKLNHYWEEISCLKQKHVICEIGWVEYDSMCFLFVAISATYADAIEFCGIAEGGSLMTIKDELANNFLFSEFAGQYGYNLWIGIDDRKTNGTFEWQRNDLSTGYTNWARNEPSGESGYDCGTLIKATGLWKTALCGGKQKYVCQRSI
ncbi:cell surface hyaluronidase CEMIP2-like [Saccoglossus kowalevskii]